MPVYLFLIDRQVKVVIAALGILSWAGVGSPSSAASNLERMYRQPWSTPRGSPYSRSAVLRPSTVALSVAPKIRCYLKVECMNLRRAALGLPNHQALACGLYDGLGHLLYRVDFEDSLHLRKQTVQQAKTLR